MNESNINPESELRASLTNEQQQLLSQALIIVKQDVFSDVTKKIRTYLMIGFGVVTLFGAVSIVGMKSAVQDAVVSALREDPVLRANIEENTVIKIDSEVDAEIVRAKKLIDELEQSINEVNELRTQDNIAFRESAEVLREMTHQLRDEHFNEP